MVFADSIVVNSQFTRQTVLETFPSLQREQKQSSNNNSNDNSNSSTWSKDDSFLLPILYPVLDTSAVDRDVSSDINDFPTFQQKPIVSLNRFERKKNLELLLQAIQWLEEHGSLPGGVDQIPPVVIAGGYDIKNVENVEYRGELQNYCNTQLSPALRDKIIFRQSISDAERTYLLKNAMVVVYTPTKEHFGIVPLESMYCETPVLAVNSGGPLETISDGKTGFLCEPTGEAFGTKLQTLIANPQQAVSMGQAARKHVVARFSRDHMLKQWKQLIDNAVVQGQARQIRNATTYQLLQALTTLFDALLLFLVLWIFTLLLRFCAILHPTEALWSGIQRLVGLKLYNYGDEF